MYKNSHEPDLTLCDFESVWVGYSSFVLAVHFLVGLLVRHKLGQFITGFRGGKCKGLGVGKLFRFWTGGKMCLW